ncbi:MAG TPA: rod-binding protein [Novosphingobium sp.]|nr:rod-binding protein [Novosphingobium sp.]
MSDISALAASNAANAATAPANAATAPTGAPAAGKADLKKAASQFEAIFLRQMLAEARKTDFGDTLFGESGGLKTFREQQDAQFADIAANSGTLGLAKMIENQLSQRAAAGTTTTTATTAAHSAAGSR